MPPPKSDWLVEMARKTARALPSGDDIRFRGVPISEFDIDQVRRMLALSQRHLADERCSHMHSVALPAACDHEEETAPEPAEA